MPPGFPGRAEARAYNPGPCAACAAHFAFGETGLAGHTLRVCCFAPEIRCARFGAHARSPGPRFSKERARPRRKAL